MDDSLGGMFKLTGSNYSMWKSKMRDMLVVKDLWLPVEFGDKRPDKIDATIWEVIVVCLAGLAATQVSIRHSSKGWLG